MRAKEVMTKGVATVSPTLTADEAWQTMRAQQIHHLLVGSLAKPVGILSARDLGGRGGAGLRKGRTVGDLMEPDIVTVDEAEPVRRIANVMRGRSIGCVLVTSGHRVAGIITVSDLLELIGRGSDRPMKLTERQALHNRVPHRHNAKAATGVW
jgi:CBS domain-containing protein